MSHSLKNKSLNMRIRSLSSSFSEKEQLIAHLIIKYPSKIIHGTINQIAEELNLADSTVFRFCKKIGYKGFQDLKIALASEVNHEVQENIHERIVESDDEKTILEKIFFSNIQTLKDTLEVIDADNFIKAVHAFLSADKIQFFGFGGSNVIAMDGYHKFIRTGLSVSSQIDSHLQLMSASQLKEGDLAVLISHTGHSKDILEILNIVKNNNVQTIGITGFSHSPLSKNVEIALHTLSEETDYRSEALASRIAQLSILDALYVNIMKSLDKDRKDPLQEVRKVIYNKRLR